MGKPDYYEIVSEVYFRAGVLALIHSRQNGFEIFESITTGEINRVYQTHSELAALIRWLEYRDNLK